MDERFIEAAIKTYGDTVLRAAASITGNKSDAEDVFSDVFFALYKREKDFDSDIHLRSWLVRSAINGAKNIKTSAWSRKRAELNENIAVFEHDFNDEVFCALKKLKDDERAVIYLHYYEGYTFKEISKTLKKREGSIRSKANRARAALKELLSN